MSGSTFARALAAGILGACAVTIAHELLRRYVPRAPRMDVLGMRGIARLSRWAGKGTPAHLHESALMGDIVSNAAYYGLVGVAGPERAVYIGAGLGLAAGLGAVVLPGPLALGSAPSSRTTATQAMTVALYTTGGLVAGSLYRALD
jgi:hypothetical protein